MRYRPFGRGGAAISAISLRLDARRSRSQTVALVYAALEHGINGLTIPAEPGVSAAVGEALNHVGRGLGLVTLRLERDLHGFRPERVAEAARTALEHGRFGWIDVLRLDEPHPGDLARETLQQLSVIARQHRAKHLGAGGAGSALDTPIDSRLLDVAALPFHLGSGWPERNRVKRAAGLNTVVVATDVLAPLQAGRAADAPVIARPRGLSGLFASKEVKQQASVYEFMDRAQGWTREQVCIAHALTEPALATLELPIEDADQLDAWAAAVDRDLPTGLAAQIEMARFAEAS